MQYYCRFFLVFLIVPFCFREDICVFPLIVDNASLIFLFQVLPFCSCLLPGSSVLIWKFFFSHVKEKL
jgi:hypothetical protein